VPEHLEAQSSYCLAVDTDMRVNYHWELRSRAESVSGLHFDLFSAHGPRSKGVSCSVLVDCGGLMIIFSDLDVSFCLLYSSLFLEE
jgi:hypothetical protein